MKTAELLAQKRAEVAELEEKLRQEEIGSIAIVLEVGWHSDVAPGMLVRITNIDDDDETGEYRGDCVETGEWDRFQRQDIRIVTQEEARAHLYAEADRMLAEAFPKTEGSR
ncbi:hypothetical protein BBD42_15490 [Paenibacillus sp. BIHB 4019]|uniref:Uncharacterized protein n=1 Tax=Paenibacillus sp. BIHB 4019 TaxID=1870819 RepID=A0A1B2DJ42_9BACL|nr:hypothetical protein [Paenibacillus sp. BIHB 4019]ANY67711.1 hypothetical protein BBD42_15490 [Paenibacillus sp. BIHB 4019]